MHGADRAEYSDASLLDATSRTDIVSTCRSKWLKLSASDEDIRGYQAIVYRTVRSGVRYAEGGAVPSPENFRISVITPGNSVSALTRTVSHNGLI